MNLSTLVNATVVVGVGEEETVMVMFLRQINYGIVTSIRLTTLLVTYKRQDTCCLPLVIDEGPAGWQLGAAEATLYRSCLLGDLLDIICQTISSALLLGVPGHLLGLRVHPGPDSGGVGQLSVLLDMLLNRRVALQNYANYEKGFYY